MLGFPKVSAQRAREIVREISFASRAKGRFFVLLITASMIASFGLIANSTAVIIGAMLVSPLMTPIFGAALGMLRGNPRMLGRALMSEAIGVVLTIGAAYLVGLPQITFADATPEMLSRTQPNLIDLLVALFAGFAGSYAMLDERVSPALPGVAIATAIVPPLSTCGLCLSLGAWSGAQGAMLLFLANFVSILIVALFTFWAGGLSRTRRQSFGRVVVHFGPTLAAFVVISIILTNSLIKITRQRALVTGIHEILDTHLAMKSGADLEELVYQRTPQSVQVMASVRAHHTISPAWVTKMESEIEQLLNTPVDLVIRTIRSRDVCSLGSSLQVVPPNMNGVFLVPVANDFEARETLATQVIREAFEKEPGFELTRVEYGLSPEDESIIVAYANAIRRLTQREIVDIEMQLQERFEDPELHFFMRVDATSLRGRNGPIQVEWTNIRSAGLKQSDLLPKIEQEVLNAFKATNEVVPIRTHFNYSKKHWRALVEIIGSGIITPDDLREIRKRLTSTIASDVELLVWHRGDFIVTEKGYSDYDSLVEPTLHKRTQQLREFFRTDITNEATEIGQ